MRLRPRGNANAGNDAATAAAAEASRTALGNISNREGNQDENDQEPKTKKTKPSGIVERVRRGRSQAAKAKEPEPEKKPAARRSSARRASAIEAAAKIAQDEKATNKKEAAAAAKKEVAAAAAKKKAAAKQEAAAKKAKSKKGGVKRSSSDGNNSKQGGRISKRAKKSDTAAVKDEPVTSRRTTRSRSQSRAKKERREVVVDIVSAGENRVVPQDFGLKRDSFNGHNFTYGIAHYDAPERSDTLQCKDYVTDMFQHIYQSETNHPTPYMDRQEDINEKMRAILVDWLVEVHMKFRLVPETLYLCVTIIDRYCSIADVPRTKLQLVGVTALFLACKHEEIYPPEVRDCVYITDRAYDRQEILDMEQTILTVLNWKISLPTAHPFLDRFLSLTKASPMTRQAATYYLERTLQEHDLLEYRPSMICVSAVILALNNPDISVLEEGYERGGLPGLPQILMEYTDFDKYELWECLSLVATKICEPAVSASRRNLNAVKKKYEHRKYQSVSTALALPSVEFVKENMSSDERKYTWGR